MDASPMEVDGDGCQPGFDFNVDDSSLKQGAEGRILNCTYLGKKAVLKERFTKKYRHPDLDRTLTKDRMKAELKGIMRCSDLGGVRVPRVYFVNSQKNQIIFERIEGDTVRAFINRHHDDANEPAVKEKLVNICKEIGKTISTMHRAGIIHGDLTTSNMLLENADPERLVMIDFGLASANPTAEEKGVDLYVLERAILSTHPFAEYLFDSILQGYKAVNEKHFVPVNAKLEEVRMRGRKRDMVG
uniref:non-specific serine/threonine protein kinase n=1 Tax=Steinernema glaseri TaxID=37863 RepID=A0A1I8AJS4_9BILA